jgi:hypothetical protein
MKQVLTMMILLFTGDKHMLLIDWGLFIGLIHL